MPIFAIAYQCQHCLRPPEIVLIRRCRWALSLEGRSPIEHIEVAGFIPKVERQFFSDALLAFNSGRILAALFYLRTFIEQFARRVTGLTGRQKGEDIMEAYSKTLPEDQRPRMPSLKDWYDRLSEKIHAAEEDAQVFEDARAAIEQHFDKRRVFKISENPPKAARAD